MRYNQFRYWTLFLSSSLISMIAFTQMNVAVAPIKMNILYTGVDNPLSVAAAGAADNKVTISIVGGGGSVFKQDAGLYNVKVTEPADDCTVNVYVDGKLVGSSKFRVRPLPKPSGSVGGFMSGAYISADQFRNQSGVGVHLVNFPFEVKYEVASFTLVLNDDKGAVNTIECEGSAFSAKAKQYLRQYIKSGDIVTIENIRVKGPNGSEMKIPSLIYNIK